jgi:hypothetical protein
MLALGRNITPDKPQKAYPLGVGFLLRALFQILATVFQRQRGCRIVDADLTRSIIISEVPITSINN